MSSTQSTTTTTSPVCAECRGMKNLKDAGVFSLAVKNPRIQCVCASKEDLQKFICEMYWIGENGGDTAEEVVAFIKKHKLLDLEEDDCVCGNNYKKGLVNNEMRCEDCDIDGKNYEEPGNCVCSFPKFYIDDGIQKCSRCGFRDHYKNGVVADYPTDEE